MSLTPNKIPSQTKGLPGINVKNPDNGVTGVFVWWRGLQALSRDMGWLSAHGELENKKHNDST